MGGSPFTYSDEVDTNRLSSLALMIRLAEIERFACRVLSEPTISPTLKRDAERVLRYIDEVHLELRNGGIEDTANAALSLGIAADALAFQWEFGRDLAAGQRKRGGGFKGAENAGVDQDIHAQWIAIDQELQGAFMKSQRARAREIARRTKTNPETVRKFLARRI
jgi:hypothetical protein